MDHVTIHRDTYVLNQDVAEKYAGQDLAVYADTLTLGDYQNKGRAGPGPKLTLRARKLVVAEGGCTIDLSGADAPDDTSVAASGSTQAHDGKDGAAGLAGHAGGDVSIWALEVCGGPITFVASGGKGGKGQDGGKGAQGSKGGNGSDAQPPTSAHHPKHDCIGGTHDSTVITFWACWWLDVIKASKGGRGGVGGNAGLAGVSGDGGAPGAVELRYLASIEHPAQDQATRGGAAGSLAACGTPGPGGEGGDSGRHLYQYWWALDAATWDLSDNGRWLHADATIGSMSYWQDPGNCKRLIRYWDDSFVDAEGRLALRTAITGPAGAAGGYGSEGAATKPEPRSGQAGEDRPVRVEAISGTETAPALTLEYVLLMLQAADDSYIDGDDEAAAAQYTWLQFIARSARETLADEAARALSASIQAYAGNCLAKLERGYTYYAEQARSFRYNNIKLYDEYVASTMTHAQAVEQRYQSFSSAQTSVADKKRDLEQSLVHYDSLIAHLDDDLDDKRRRLETLNTAVETLHERIEELSAELAKIPDELQREILAKAREDAFGWSDLVDLVSLGLGCATAVTSVSSEVKSVLELLKKGVDIGAALVKLINSTSKVFNSVKKICENGYKIFSLVQGGSAASNPGFVFPELGGSEVLLIPEMLELEFFNAKNEFEAEMSDYMGFSAAKQWKALLWEQLATAETKVKLAEQAANLYQENNELHFQREQLRQSKAYIEAQLRELHYDPNADTSVAPVQLCYRATLRSTIYRVLDEWTAYRLWTLSDDPAPSLGSDLSVAGLEDRVYTPIADKVREYILDVEKQPGEFRPDEPLVWTRAEHPAAFARLEAEDHTLTLEIPLPSPEHADFRNIRLKHLSVYLVGAASNNGRIYLEVVHSGNCSYLSTDGRALFFNLPTKTIACGYTLDAGKPDFSIIEQSLINDPFDLGYSLYTSFTIRVPDRVEPTPGMAVFNEGIRHADISEIQLFPVFHFNPKAKQMNARVRSAPSLHGA